MPRLSAISVKVFPWLIPSMICSVRAMVFASVGVICCVCVIVYLFVLVGYKVGISLRFWGFVMGFIWGCG